MNEKMIEALQTGGIAIYGDNGEHIITTSDVSVLEDFLTATDARHFSHHFEPLKRARNQHEEIHYVKILWL